MPPRAPDHGAKLQLLFYPDSSISHKHPPVPAFTLLCCAKIQYKAQENNAGKWQIFSQIFFSLSALTCHSGTLHLFVCLFPVRTGPSCKWPLISHREHHCLKDPGPDQWYFLSLERTVDGQSPRLSVCSVVKENVKRSVPVSKIRKVSQLMFSWLPEGIAQSLSWRNWSTPPPCPVSKHQRQWCLCCGLW